MARKFGAHRREARKALASAMPAGRKIPERERPKLAAAIPFIDGILESDRKAPRKQLHGKLETLGDFRRGAVSVNYRKCGKSNCACAQRDHPGHGPQYLWNASVGGKTRTRNLPLGPELEKVEQEVERYREFDRLCQEPVEVNDQICHLHPVPVIGDENEAEQLNKTAEAFRQEAEEEISRLIGRVPGDRQRLGRLDLEASEMAIRAVMHQRAGLLLAKLLNCDGGGYRGMHIDCGQGHQA